MDAEQFDQIEQAVRHEMSAEQRVRIEVAARDTNAEQAVAALLGEKAVSLDNSRLCPICGAGGAVKNGRDRRGLQRFVCRAPGCGHSFTAVTGTWLSGMHLPDKWLAFAESLIGRRSLDWVKENASATFIWSRPASAAPRNLPKDGLRLAQTFPWFGRRTSCGHAGRYRRGGRDVFPALLQGPPGLEERATAGRQTAAVPRIGGGETRTVHGAGPRPDRSGPLRPYCARCPDHPLRRRHRGDAGWTDRSRVGDLL